MKKFIGRKGWALCAVLGMTFTVACSSDDGNGNGPLEPPVYSKEAVKCEFTDPDAPYESLELTESGDYILVVQNDEPNVGPAPFAASPLRGISRAESGSNVKHGTYTKTGEKSYELTGLGTVAFTENSIRITPKNGSTTTYAVDFPHQLPTSHPIDLLCRSWKCVQWRIVVHSSEGSLDKSFSSFDAMRQFADEGEPEDNTGEGFWVQPTFEDIILSRYGTLALTGREYHDNTFLGATLLPELWTATGNNKGRMILFDDDPDYCTFEVKNGQLVLTVNNSEVDEDGRWEEYIICTLVENKH